MGLDNGNKMETICGILVAKKNVYKFKTCFTTIKAYNVKWYEKTYMIILKEIKRNYLEIKSGKNSIGFL
jgi:hypothetical protein